MHDLGHPVAEGKMRTSLIINIIVLLQEPLQCLVTLNVVLFQTEDLEGLLLCDEAALDTKTLLGNLLAALVRKLLGLVLIVLLCDELKNSLVPLRNR